MAALDETGLPVLGSAELELLFKLDDGTEGRPPPPPSPLAAAFRLCPRSLHASPMPHGNSAGGPYQMLEKPAAWALDPSPAGAPPRRLAAYIPRSPPSPTLDGSLPLGCCSRSACLSLPPFVLDPQVAATLCLACPA